MIFLKVKYGIGRIPASYVKLIAMNTYIHIPKPCHENWNAMLPEEQGRHCLKCCKTVVDFTSWEAGDIKDYLETNAQQKVCGRFREDQLDNSIEKTISNIWQSALPALKKIAAVFLLAFGVAASSCSDYKGKIQQPQVVGEIAVVLPDTTTVPEMTTGAPVLMGDTVLTEDCKKKVE